MIKDIHIQNYNGITDLKINNCKRINLLVGKNGVGKTTILEYIHRSYYREYAPFYSSWRFYKACQESNIVLFDEIENGLHHTAMKDFWLNVIKSSIASNLQVFATTHSYDMIKALVEAAKEQDLIEEDEEKDEIRLFTINKGLKNVRHIFKYNSGMLLYAIREEIEIR